MPRPLRGALWAVLAAAVAVPASGAGAARAAANDTGRDLYLSQCAGCHGDEGRGDGPAARFLYPRPRNFRSQPFKLGGSQEDVHRTVARGIVGTSMPAFAGVLADREIDAVASYVRSLAGPRAVALPAGPVRVPEKPGDLRRGRQLYEEGCVSCHGKEGRGDGPSARLLRDDAGLPIRPANLARGAFKGGSEPAALFRRISAGMPGTPMPAYGDAFSEADRWSLVAYLRSLIREKPAGPAAPLEVGRVARVPRDPSDPVWRKAAPRKVALNPLWQRPEWPPAVRVRAVHDGQTIAWRLEWEDATRDDRIGRTTEFSDALALMLPVKAGRVPFIGMGRGDDVARILHWRAVGGRAGPAVAHPRLVRDANPWEGRAFALPARLVGNPLALAPPEGGIYELIAAGPGTLTALPPGRAYAQGRARWSEGRWAVVIARPMDVPRRDVRLGPGTATHLAVAVWDGSAGDRNGQKSISQWIAMEVAK